MKTLSVTIICKDEQANLARLLPSLGFADQIVVVDTGSSDQSVTVARQYADVYFYKWNNDFSKARNYAISKATSEYVMWLDCDDDLPFATIDTLRRWLADDKQKHDFIYLKYRMGENSQFWFWRERIIRRCPECRFKGFIHEAICPFGQTRYLDCDVVHTSNADHSARNLAIYRDAIKQRKRFTMRDKFYYARTLTENGLSSDALPIFRQVAQSSKTYIVDRVSAYKSLARIYLKQNEFALAAKILSNSAALLPPDAETCCLFGDTYYCSLNYFHAALWYELALQTRVQVGFVNDYYKKLYPLIQLSVCWWRQGDVSKARYYHKLAKACDPTNAVVLNNDKWFSLSQSNVT